MALSNYTEIASAVELWLNRSGFSSISDNADEFINIAQRRIQREVRVPAMEATRSLTFNSDGEASIPSGYLEAKYMIGIDGTHAWGISPSTFIEVKKRQESPAFRSPTVFDVESGVILVGAKPESGQSFELVYYKALPFVSSTVPKNWFSENAPELILFAALGEAADFMKDFELADRYEGKYQKAKTLLMREAETSQHSGSPLSVRTVR